MSESESNETNSENQEQEGSLGCGCLIIILVLALVIFAFNSCIRQAKEHNNLSSKTDPTTQEVPKNEPNMISAQDFKGKWALTVPKTYIECVRIGQGSLTGATVNIEGVEYAITRNVTNKDFLPNKYWKDAPFEKIDQYNVCSDVPIGNECKTSLSDMVEYADTLCK